MENLKLILQKTTVSGEHTMAMLRALQVTLKICENKVTAFMVRDGGFPDGALWRMASEIERLYSCAVEMGQATLSLTQAIRTELATALAAASFREGEHPDYLRLAGACDQVIQGLEVVDRTIAFVAERASVDVEVIREAALRRDAPPEIVAAADRLLERVRGPASSP